MDAGTLRAFLTVFSFALLLGLFFGVIYSIPTSNIAIVPIVGEITGSGSDIFSSSTTSTSVIELIDSAESNPNVRAIILEINSPGGTVLGTKEIVARVKSASKPVVAWIREIGASGAYWIASASDAIVADPLSITGSIGVSAAYLSFEGLFHKYGVTYENISMPGLKDMGSPYKNLTDRERVLFAEILNETYKAFVEDVASNRGIEVDELINISEEGAVFLGSKAYSKGLVDHLGGKELAINVSAELGNIEYPVTEKYGKTISIFSLLAGLLTSSPNIDAEQFELRT
jgi:protease-4